MRSAGKKKRSKKAAALEVDSIFAALEDSEAPSGEQEAASHSAASNGGLKLGGREHTAAPPSASAAAAPAAAAPAEPAARQGRKGKAAKAAGAADDLDALLAEIESSAPAGKKKPKRVCCGAGVPTTFTRSMQ